LKFSTTPTPQVENPSDSSTPTPQPCSQQTLLETRIKTVHGERHLPRLLPLQYQIR